MSGKRFLFGVVWFVLSASGLSLLFPSVFPPLPVLDGLAGSARPVVGGMLVAIAAGMAVRGLRDDLPAESETRPGGAAPDPTRDAAGRRRIDPSVWRSAEADPPPPPDKPEP